MKSLFVLLAILFTVSCTKTITEPAKPSYRIYVTCVKNKVDTFYLQGKPAGYRLICIEIRRDTIKP